MPMTKELAQLKLSNILGEKEAKTFLSKEVIYPDELATISRSVYHAYGPKEAHEIFDTLGVSFPHIEDSITNRGTSQLEQLQSGLWQYPFSTKTPLSLIEIGMNQIVLYPTQTQLGQR